MSAPNPDQLAALASYARRHGRTWRASLRAAWESGRDEREPEGALLRQIRNQYGPAWLTRFQLPKGES